MDSLFTLTDFLRFADKIRDKKDILYAFLNNLKRQGNTVYAYGAPAKGNTLLNYEGIDSTIIEKAVEINDLKIGSMLPVSNIPIEKESPDDLPDYYLLLSHNFQEEILKKNKGNGVKFIIPFPEIKVIEA